MYKLIRSDNGHNYIDEEIKKLFIEKGIREQFAASYLAQQSGIAERGTGTLMEAEKCSLIKIDHH